MNIAVSRTAAEQAISERFEAIADALPGNDTVQQARRDAIGAFAGRGLPHRRVEEWKYTDLRQIMKEVGSIAPAPAPSLGVAAVNDALGPLADLDALRLVIVDGAFSETLSSGDLPEGVSVTPLSETLAADPAAVLEDASPAEGPHHGMVGLNTALMTDGVVIDVAAGTEIAAPVMVVNVRTGDEARMVATRAHVAVGADARLTLMEVFVGGGAATAGDTVAVNQLRIGDRAEVTHVKVTTEAAATHVATLNAELGAETNYRPFFYTAGPAVTRNQLAVFFGGEDAKLDASGAFLANGRQHIDNTLFIDHAVPGCESRELFKGVLDDHARGVFQGKVVVRQIAQKTDGKQMAQALMLSPTCEFDSKPELEIYADDVACGHGSTCAEIDPDLVFYLRARGIPEATARALLMESFVGQAIEQVEHEAVAEALKTLAQHWLKTNAG